MDNSQDYLTKNLVLPLWNDKSLDVIDNFFADNVEIRTTFVSGTGPDTLKQSVKNTFIIFPNLQVKINEIVRQGNKHIYKWTGKGFQEGPFMSLPPTGAEIQFSGVVFGEMTEGYVTKYHSFSNLSHALQKSYYFPGWGIDNADYPRKTIGSRLETLYQALKKLSRFPLTKREIECLFEWIRGCSIKETARRMGGLSERTVQTYRENIKRKFGVYTFQQVLHIIQYNGLLHHML